MDCVMCQKWLLFYPIVTVRETGLSLKLQGVEPGIPTHGMFLGTSGSMNEISLQGSYSEFYNQVRKSYERKWRRI